MTEMPAKTPSPMGRTDSFLPGSTNAAWEVAELSAAEVAELDEELPAFAAAAEADITDAEGDGVVVAADAVAADVALDAAAADVAALPATVDKPFTDIADAPVPAADALVAAADALEAIVANEADEAPMILGKVAVVAAAEVDSADAALVAADEPLPTDATLVDPPDDTLPDEPLLPDDPLDADPLAPGVTTQLFTS